MADPGIDPKPDHLYRNRINRNLVAQVSQVKDGFVIFYLVAGLREGYPYLDTPHKMRYREFIRYYTDNL